MTRTTALPTMTPRELWRQRFEQAQAELQAEADGTVQRDWLILMRQLDCTRQQIAEDSATTMLAMAWVREKRLHGGARLDRFLGMTTQELEDLWSFPRRTEDELPEAWPTDDLELVELRRELGLPDVDELDQAAGIAGPYAGPTIPPYGSHAGPSADS